MSDLQPTPDFSVLAALIEARRGRVARLVNRELIDLYWELGAHISQRIATDGWGRGTVSLLSSYLSSRMPSARGFSASNLWRMRQFFEIWNPPTETLATALREVSWSCHLDLMGRCKSAWEREFYLLLAIRENHSVRELRRAIDTATFERSALADSKLATLSRVSPLAPQSHFRDSYIIEFLDLPPAIPKPTSAVPWSGDWVTSSASWDGISPLSARNFPSRWAPVTDRSTCSSFTGA